MDTYSDELFHWAFYKTSEKELAADLVQETFLKAFKNLNGFKEESSPKTWLFSILNHLVIDFYRQKEHDPLRKVDETFFDRNDKWSLINNPKEWSDLEEEPLLDQPDFVKTLDDCIDSLPKKWSAVIRKKYVQAKKSKEICKELELSSSNYWQIVHRAKIQLRSCLEKKWFKP